METDVEALLAEIKDSPVDHLKRPFPRAEKAGGGGVDIDDLLNDISSDTGGQSSHARRPPPQPSGVAFSTYDAPAAEEAEETQAKKPPARLEALGGIAPQQQPQQQQPQQQQQQQQQQPLPALRRQEPADGDASPRDHAADAARVEPPPVRKSALVSALPTQGIAPSARWGHALVGTPDSLYVHGGMSASGAACGDMHRLSTVTSEWTATIVFTSTPPPARYDHAGAFVGGEVVLYGGMLQGEHTPSDQCYAFDTADQVWRSVDVPSGKKSPPGHCGHSMSAYKRKVYVFGGRVPRQEKEGQKSRTGHSKVHFSKELWIVDPRSGKWRHVKAGGAVPRARSGHSSCVCQDRLWVHGGQDADAVLSDLLCFDPHAQAWREVIVSPGPPRFRHALVAASDTLVCVGGGNGKEVPLVDTMPAAAALAAAAEPEAGQPPPARWQPLRTGRSTPGTLSGCGGAVVGGVFYAFGGTDQPTAKAGNAVRRGILIEPSAALAEGGGAAALLPSVFAAVQADGRADLRMLVNGRAVLAHRWVIDARARALLEAVSECEEDDSGAFCLDGSSRRAGLKFPNHATLQALVHYLYCARLPDDTEKDVLDALSSVAQECKIQHLSEHLSHIGAGKVHRAERTAMHALDSDTRDLYGAIQRRRGVRRELCDVILEPRDLPKGQQPPRAHAALLSAASPALRGAVREAAAASDGVSVLRIPLPGVQAVGLTAALDFIYTGRCEVAMMSAPAVMACASVLDLPGLREAAAGAVWTGLHESFENVSDVLEIAARHGAVTLRDVCVETLAARYRDAVRCGSFAQLSPELRALVERLAEELK